MRLFAILLTISVCGISCSGSTDDFQPETIVALERGALDRWGKGEPQGFFDIMASDLTYFDPMTAKRIDGQDALKKHIAPFTGKIKIEKVEIIDPKVQRSGDLASGLGVRFTAMARLHARVLRDFVVEARRSHLGALLGRILAKIIPRH